MAWSVTGNIKGPKGGDGQPGADGADGFLDVVNAPEKPVLVDADAVPVLDGTDVLRRSPLSAIRAYLTPFFAETRRNPGGDKVTLGPPLTDGSQPDVSFIDGLHNVLSYNNFRGGSVTATRNGAALTFLYGSTADSMFAPDQVAYITSAPGDVIVVTVTPWAALNYQQTVGVSMATEQCFRDVKIDLLIDGTWEQVYESLGSIHGWHWKYVNLDAKSATQIRYTLTNPKSGESRIRNLFVHGHTSFGGDAFLPRGGRVAVYGTPALPPTIFAKGDVAATEVSIKLGHHANGALLVGPARFSTGVPEFGMARIAADSADANTSLNLQTKGNGVVQANGSPVGVKVAVPATAASPGVLGHWAEDGNNVYFYTATGWRRAAIAAW